MAKYQGQYREELDTAEEEIVEPTPSNIENAEKPFEEASFKKRYGDLRRHMQQQMTSKDDEMEALKVALGQATKKQIKFPKTDSEVADWVKKYPDVAKIIDTIAQRRVVEGQRATEANHSSRVKAIEEKLGKESAEKELFALHPDFDEIRTDSSFHDWVAEQPKMIADSLYKNNTDAKAAARSLDLYKQDKGIKTKRKANNASAAKSVGRTASSAPSSKNSTFSETQVDKMSAVEYEKNEDAILKSIQNGTFDYDLTGAAR